MPDESVLPASLRAAPFGADADDAEADPFRGVPTPSRSIQFNDMAEQIVRSLRPHKVFDAGCGDGLLVAALCDRAVETWGRDISNAAILDVRPDLRAFVTQGSIADPIEGDYDLIICLEVLQHLQEDEVARAISSMAGAAPRLLVSVAPTDRGTASSVTARPLTWWLRQFAQAGMVPVADYDASFVTPHAYLLAHSDEVGSGRDGAAFVELIRQRLIAHERAVELALVGSQAVAMRAELDRLREQATAAGRASAARLADQARISTALLKDRDSALTTARTEAATLQAQLDRLLSSTSWRVTQPIRRAAAALPVPVRRVMRRMARVAYSIGTGQFRRGVADLRSSNDRPASPEADYDRWVRAYDTLTDKDRLAIRAHVTRLAYQPLISVVMPAYETQERLLREAIASVQAQLYPNWELCIADDASPSPTVSRVLSELAAIDPRIRWMRREQNGHIAAATNSALKLGSGEFVALMDHDDLLSERALYEVVVALNDYPQTDLVFTDEDQVDTAGRRYGPYFKPDFNIDLLLGHNMISHLGVYRRSLIDRIGGLREGVVDGSQDYDLALRTVAACGAARVRHVSAVLYHWRRLDEDNSFSQVHLDRCVLAARRAISDHLAESGCPDAELMSVPAAPLWTRVRWPLAEPVPRVSLIVPTRDNPELLARCAAALLQRTDYPDFELVIVDNDSVDPKALRLLKQMRHDSRVRVLPIPGPFNYSALNNAAVREAAGEVVVLINNDIDVIDDEWLREMVSHAMRPDVGAVGAKLLYGDGRIQHAGVVLGVGSHRGGPGVAGHFGHFAAETDGGYFGQFVMTRELSAVTGACLALRKSVYEMVGGLDEAMLPVSFNDVDLCLRIRAHGFRIVWTPFAQLYHLESASRGVDRTPEQVARAAGEADTMRERWASVLDADPFYNLAFDRIDDQFRLGSPPRRIKPWLRPSA